MNEPAMSFGGIVQSLQKEVVRIFFKEMWDKADKSLIPKLFHPDFTFRGSLGPVLRGREQLRVMKIWLPLHSGYTFDILDLVEERNKVYASSGTMNSIGVNCSDTNRPHATCGGTARRSLRSRVIRFENVGAW